VSFDRTSFLVSGLVTRPHGVRGELRVRLHNAASTALEEVEEIYLDLPGAATPPRCFAVAAARWVEGGALLELEGVADRDQADALRGAEVCVRREDLPPLGDGEIYLVDLEGCEVVTRAGDPWGRVAQVRDLGAHDVLVIHDGEVERLLPYVPAFVVAVDLEARRVVVDPPEGLPEERRARR